MFTSAVSNFTNFAPLGTVLVMMLGIGLAERSGLISALLRGLITIVGTFVSSIFPSQLFSSRHAFTYHIF